MSQDEATIQRAVTLLSSSDTNENKNGAALVINTAANAHSVPKLLRANIVNLILPKLNSNDEDLVMKACWAVNNLCVHDEGRNACVSGGVLQYFNRVLQNRSSEVIKKACWALTNIARNNAAQRDIVNGPVFTGLVNILLYGKNDEEKGFALQPLCNLVLEGPNQLAFKNAGGLPATVKLLSSSVAKTQELAVTLVSFVTTNHDSIREELVNHGVLPPICHLLSGAKTGKLQEYAINCLVNLSLSEKAEHAILTQSAVRPVVGLLNSDDSRLTQQAAMLLSNLLTNKQIRESVRYYAWVDPVLKLVRSGDPAIIQQVLRVIINITFDDHCRFMLQKADATGIINSSTSKSSDNNVYNLSSTAIKNLSVPVSAVIQSEVNQRISSGGIERVNAPRAAENVRNEVDFGGLDDVLKDYKGHKPTTTTTTAAHHVAKPPPPRHDDLDDLLDYNPKKPEPSKPSFGGKSAPPPPKNTGYDIDIDDLLNDVPSKQPPKASNPPKPPPMSKHNDLDDIDDLLSGIDSKKSAPPPPKPPVTHHHHHHDDDIDDLLADIDTKGSAKPPPKPPAKNDLDDIDDLLADMNPSHGSANTRSSMPPQDDIDDLLNGIGGGSGGYGVSASYNAGDDIDDLLSDLTINPRHSNRSNAARSNTNSGLDAIDDLLADLTG